MTINRMIELLEIEQQCVTRKSRDNCYNCNLCDLVQSDLELQEMYAGVIAILKEQPNCDECVCQSCGLMANGKNGR